MAETLEPQPLAKNDSGRDYFWNRLRWRAVASLLPRGRDFTLLDVGAGAGLVGEYLAKEFPRAVYRFVEPDSTLRQALRKRYGAKFDDSDRSGLTHADVVTLLDVLEHQPDDTEFLDELARQMRDGALLLITVPAHPTLWSSWDRELGHLRRYTLDSLGAVLAGAPLEVSEVSYLFPGMLPFALLRYIQLRDQPGGPTPDVQKAFPTLPRLLNLFLYTFGLPAVWARMLMPSGTCLFAVARKKAVAREAQPARAAPAD